jgi:LPXTG-motif cell wall-anchored protein
MARRAAWGIATTALIVALAIGIPASAAAADSAPPGTIGSFPTWAVTPSTTAGQTFTGSANFTTAAGFPTTTFTTNSTTTKAPTGESAFLGASTGFGQHFGSTRSQPYLYLSPASGSPSTTTLTFATPPPAGWGFALGDIDADFVEITATDSTGIAIPAGTLGGLLGAQDTTNVPPLNYCNGTPKPSSCTGAGPFTDVPEWFPTGTTIGATTYVNPVVEGHGTDTSGAYDWFLPTSNLKTLTFTYHVLSGFPIFQLWLAASAPVATITGTVTPPAGETDPAGTAVALENANGTPVLDIENEPVVDPVSPTGAFTIEAEDAHYELAFDVPSGFEPIPSEAVDATAGGIDMVAAVQLDADPALATTGVDTSAPLAAGGAVIVAGLLLLLARRRRSTRSRG